MGINYVKDIKVFEEILSSRSKSQINNSIEAVILKYDKLENLQFYKLSLYLANIECNQFIIKAENFNINIKNITIKLKDLKLKMIRNNNFIEIKNYTILNKDVFIQKDHINYHFQLPEKINDININSFASKIIAIKLKVKETDLITSFEYEFLDLFNNKIKVDSGYKFSDDFFENDRIYLFNGFYYNNKTLYATNFSSIEMIDQNSIIDNNYFPKDIDRIKIGEIVNLEGLIIDLNIVEFSVLIEELNSHEKVKLKLNYELIKKINPNRKCQFISVKKIDDKIFELTQLTDIYANFDTTIGLKIYDIQDKYYNRININNSYVDIVDENINENMLKFNIDAKDKSVLFEQKFIFEKVRKINDKKCDKDNFVIEDSYEFTLEVNNGRMNKFPCF